MSNRLGTPSLTRVTDWSPFINSSPPGQNGRPFADDVFNYIFVTEKFCISIQISLNLVPKCPIDRNPAMV